MTDVENWDADMDAWGLTGDQRAHHLWRLHDYHKALSDKHWARYERTSRIERWFALAAIVALILAVAQLVGGAR